MTPDPQPTSSTLSPGWIASAFEQPPHDRHIARAAALFEAGDAAEQRPAEADRAVARRQYRDQRFPLAGREVERQQHQRRPSTPHAKRDIGDFAILLTQAGRRKQVAELVELTDRGIDVVPPISSQVGPGEARVIVEHHCRGLGQSGQHRAHPAGAEPMVAG